MVGPGPATSPETDPRAKVTGRRSPPGPGGDPILRVTSSTTSGAMRYVVGILNELGLHADLRIAPRSKYFSVEGIYSGGPQVYLLGWVADLSTREQLPSPTVPLPREWQRIRPLRPGAPGGDGGGRTAPETDPAAANAAWIAIEHTLVKEAIWAPLINPGPAVRLLGPHRERGGEPPVGDPAQPALGPLTQSGLHADPGRDRTAPDTTTATWPLLKGVALSATACPTM